MPHPSGRQAASLVTLCLLTLTAPAAAQVVAGGDLVATDLARQAVFRITPAGAVSTLVIGAPLTSPSGIAVGNAREVVIADFGGALYSLTTAGPPVLVASGLSGPIRVAVDRNGDYLVTELTRAALTRVTPGGAVAPIYQGAPFLRPFGVAVDGDGSYLVADDRAKALFRVTTTGVATIHQGPPFQLPQGVAVLANGDYAVIDGLADAVFRVPRAGGTVTTLAATPAIGNPCGITSDFEGGVYVSQSSAFGNSIDRVSRFGTVTPLASGAPFQNLEALARAPQLTGPSAGTTGALQSFDLQMPDHPSTVYAAFACLSLYPGLTLPGTPLATPCNPDLLLQVSAGANNSVFVGFAGVLSPTGTAQPGLNLPAALPVPAGTTFFLQALALGTGVPSGIRSFSNVHALTY